MHSDLFDRLKTIFGTILPPDSLATLSTESTMDNTEGWDSLNFLNVIMGIESEFGVRIDGLDAANMVSISNILAYLESHTQVSDNA